MDPATSPFDDRAAGATGVDAASRRSGGGPLDKGGVVNLLADLRKRLAASEELAKLTDVQNRLVMKRLEDAGTWKRPRVGIEEQIQRIAKTIAGVTGMEEEILRGELERCC